MIVSSVSKQEKERNSVGETHVLCGVLMQQSAVARFLQESPHVNHLADCV